ncbi:UDP-N-acetylmuramoyl-L-alanyl-D-glutamate--2,6-diaminopimelate ligase [Pelagibius litoralis]|uniref:UDP-N-acetylmuramoyl-L-alanyl-D-glutamate--2,6-diaminopimelate ligase n=1 Tax=Pelagibius litoralis TaxID=374515 RepID=A0A967C4H9_9PROT|nr:UDP-N-acetylmuramoyl-L-alanyl-D-glutamate--2,6-diaminopimelate ligase [Pelagibius litoralis]NIA68620.1 UDP-N-acetylmuramoyl-L-alanyl-D-glutamate--2,6-diaminopimelate ligase [Pelagibius litoralis]
MQPEAVPAEAHMEVDISGMTADSRQVAEGYLFAALPGSRVDGRDFIAQALEKGAAAILAPEGTDLPAGARPVALITDANPRRRLALLAARFFERQPATAVTVTGTNGKTSVASFTTQIWHALGREAASLGTLGLQPPRPDAPASLTTPDPVELHRCLASLARDRVDHVVLEASSHGLDQYRLDGIRVSAAAFTNLTRDHLDYHGSMEAYLAAKLRLFTELLQPDGSAVVNIDDPAGVQVAEACRARGLKLLTYGRSTSDLQLLGQVPTATGQDLKLRLLGKDYAVSLGVVGAFQADNVLAALGLVIAGGIDADAAVATLDKLGGVPGRVELVGETAAGGHVYVDFAHTPDALETVLAALRPHTRGELSVVVGCGGDRDRGKRPQMGGIAVRLADKAYITDDNPRSEDPAAIRREMLAAAPGAQEIGDRGVAIATAVAALGSGDVLVIAGKGHETGQIVGGQVLPFDDRDVARTAIRSTEEAQT